MNSYTVTIGPRNKPRLTFAAMAADSCACAAQHIALVQPGERMSVEPIRDDAYFVRADASEPSASELERRMVRAAAEAERRRERCGI